MNAGQNFARFIELFVIIAIFLSYSWASPIGRYNLRTRRLCSKSLSDALYLVCHDRGGYNEPYSYSGEIAYQPHSGPGLVEECCHHSCTYEQLELYCKYSSPDSQNNEGRDSYSNNDDNKNGNAEDENPKNRNNATGSHDYLFGVRQLASSMYAI